MNKTPKLRFKEFSGELESTVLDGLAEITMGQSPIGESYNSEGEGIGLINGPVEFTNKYPVVSQYTTKPTKYCNDGDILFCVRGSSIGRMNISDDTYCIGRGVASIRAKKNKSTTNYIYALLQNKLETIIGFANGSTFPNISSVELKKSIIKVPKLEEQEKIASFFSLIDDKISLQGEKVEALKDYKNGMMQKIFSRELRFKGFSKEWKTTTLGKVTNSFEYGMNAAATEFDGENKYIRITDIDENTSKYINKNIVSPLGELEDKYLVKENDILFARTGASTGKTYIYDNKDGNLYFAGFLIKANVNRDNSSKFIFFQTKTKEYDKWIKIMSMRSGQPGINAKEYASYSFLAPSKEEQEKIGDFLMKIDKKIDNEMSKLESLNEYKKGLLQQMFV